MYTLYCLYYASCFHEFMDPDPQEFTLLAAFPRTGGRLRRIGKLRQLWKLMLTWVMGKYLLLDDR